ncbi:MAG: hypothetical protein KC422_10665 [Trueperaceae bacterium]|nr:hypothetical protein [Trueperaceae bacterium]
MTFWHDSFYRFVYIDDPEALGKKLEQLCNELEVKGSIILAPEGINAMLAGTEEALDKVQAFLDSDKRFKNIFYKRTLSHKMPFRRLRIRIKDEIVPLGIDGVSAIGKTGIEVPPEEWRELIKEDDVILIDNRNSFEYELGHFKGAIDPKVDNFRHFADYVKANLDDWKDKKVAMYCTGGIRCEKTTAWMKDLGMEVYQLEGGIINYFAQIPDADKDYEGECFVFDWRICLDTKLEETETSIEDVDRLQYGEALVRKGLR